MEMTVDMEATGGQEEGLDNCSIKALLGQVLEFTLISIQLKLNIKIN